MAPAEPSLVGRAVVEATKSPSLVIRHEIIGLVPLLPTEIALRVAHKVIEWAENGFGLGGYFWASDEVIGLIRFLYSSQVADVQALGKNAVHGMFHSRRGDDAFSGVNALVPRYAYSRAWMNCEM